MSRISSAKNSDDDLQGNMNPHLFNLEVLMKEVTRNLRQRNLKSHHFLSPDQIALVKGLIRLFPAVLPLELLQKQDQKATYQFNTLPKGMMPTNHR
jgi:hypothetical protein